MVRVAVSFSPAVVFKPSRGEYYAVRLSHIGSSCSLFCGAHYDEAVAHLGIVCIKY
jgi:hypothetical protein